ncbi:hypothetical protein [Pelosinus sp. sgz500959]|uniref:hypothetical protein n=1 Tax=Pelosinus sp. sgz500959 TaxID=3242472 RepID=UPI00366F8629
MEFAELSQEQQTRWQENVKRLGLNPATAGNQYARYQIFSSLEAFRKAVNAPIQENQREALITHANLAVIADKHLQQAVMAHISGNSIISDQAILDEIDKRFERYMATIYAAPNKEVTKEHPLVIDSNSAIAQYGAVTIQPGGYIKILVPCLFECQSLTKVDGEPVSGSDYDIYVLGKNGTKGVDGDRGASGTPGLNGKEGKANCSSANRPSSPGTDGTTGSDGRDGYNGKNGDSGTEVGIIIHQLASNITILNQGGDGGNGGNGGNGGDGGKGGDGGNGDKCSTSMIEGSIGGDGGNGGNGGNGSNGGNGGNGGKLTVSVDNVNKVKVINGKAPGGLGGYGGTSGAPGVGGTGGSNGGDKGKPGIPGKHGVKGIDGSSGDQGTIKIIALT